MLTLKVQVPNHDCKNCPYLKNHTVDHNYYGESEEKTICSIFGLEVVNFKRLSECNPEEDYSCDVRKYADFLVKEINQIAEETYVNALTDFANTLKPCVTRPEIIDQIAQTLKTKAGIKS